MRKTLAATLSVLAVLFVFGFAHAELTIITPETLMQAQTADVLALETYAGIDFSTELQSTYTLDTGNGSFSYSLVPGQTYLGQPFSLSGSGTYDATTTTFSWADSGEFGSAAWSGSGQMQWTGDDPSSFTNISVTIAGVRCLISGTNNTTPIRGSNPPAGTSTGQINILPQGSATTLTYDTTDTYSNGTYFVKITSTIPGTGGTISWQVGKSVATFTPVPAPAAILLLGPSLVGLAATRRRFKK
jgi:hypothetical protein